MIEPNLCLRYVQDVGCFPYTEVLDFLRYPLPQEVYAVGEVSREMRDLTEDVCNLISSDEELGKHFSYLEKLKGEVLTHQDLMEKCKKSPWTRYDFNGLIFTPQIFVATCSNYLEEDNFEYFYRLYIHLKGGTETEKWKVESMEIAELKFERRLILPAE